MKNKLIGLWVILIAILFIFLFRKEKTSAVETSHFAITYPSDINIDYINQLTAVLDTFYANVSNDLTVDADGKLALHLYSSRWSYFKNTYNYKKPATIKSLSEIHVLLQETDTSSNKLIVHEMMQLILTEFMARELEMRSRSNSDLTYQEFPPWLWEAVSLYEEKDFKDPRTVKSLRGDKAPQLSDMVDVAEGALIYNCGYTLMEYVIVTYGQPKYIELIKSFGNVQRVLGISEMKLVDDWYQYVQSKYINS